MDMISKCYASCKHNPGWGLLVLRVVLGAVFIAHGWQKIQGITGVIGFFAVLGFGATFAYIVAYGELLAGIAMVLGIFSRIAGYFLAIVMLVAIYTVKLKIGFLSTNGAGYELDLALLAMALCISLAGPGAWALGKKVCGCGGCQMCADKKIV